MTHKSIPYLTVIDVNDLEIGLKFWAGVLGAVYDPSDNDETVFKRLKVEATGQYFLLQRVPELKTPLKNRVHIDIATDNIQAEVDRLVSLGASVAAKRETLTVLADPFGNEFCVVSPQDPRVLDSATSW